MQSRRNIPNRKRNLGAGIFVSFLLTCGVYYGFRTIDINEYIDIETIIPEPETPAPPIIKYGFDLSQFQFDTINIQRNQMIGDILLKYGVTYEMIAELEKKAKDVFSVRKLQAGKNLTIVKRKNGPVASCVIYEPDPFQYVIYDFQDTVKVELVEKEYDSCIESASGKVESSLWEAMTSRGFSPALISKMEDALAWSVDFYHTQKGDEFKLIYEQKYIEGEPVSIGRLLAAYYKNNLEHYAVYFENENYQGFYDLEGRPTKKEFLKSPLKLNYRISSRFSYRRFHPVLKTNKPHLGTDYAAPYGTPIRAVANGVVIAASYTKGNGRYVKIKHDNVYKSQYLHMSKFAKNIRNGVHVRQGQTIGYVGSSGLATGPHVCFRFWKNDRQVDHLRENFPPPEPMEEKDLPEFFKVKDYMVSLLNQVDIQEVIDSELFADNSILGD